MLEREYASTGTVAHAPLAEAACLLEETVSAGANATRALDVEAQSTRNHRISNAYASEAYLQSDPWP